MGDPKCMVSESPLILLVFQYRHLPSIQVWQTSYLAGFIWWTYHRDWPWTHTVFMVLHCLTMVMKQHSYASYNGYCKIEIRVSLLCMGDLANHGSV
jgi:hypothetical protein